MSNLRGSMHGQVGIGDVTTVIGILFSGSKNLWEEIATRWAEDVPQKSKDAGIDTEAGDFTLIHIALPCGEQLSIKAIADIPRETMPCPCGDPGHYLVMYAEL